MKNLISFLPLCFLAALLSSQPNIQWQKTLGGSEDEVIQSIKKTNDGGFIIAGKTNSIDGDFSGNHGGTDIWVAKLTQDGNTQWLKTLGGSDFEFATSIQPCSDGGYVLVGSTESIDGDITANHGRADLWVVKLDNVGELQWQKTFGGSGADLASSVQQTNEGGYIVAGSTESNDGDVSGNHGLGDYWILKLSAAGSLEWQKILGGSYGDHAHSILQTTEGGYIVAGGSESTDGDVTDHVGYETLSDYWVVKLSESGDVQWKKSYGGGDIDAAYAIRPTNDGGYILTGYARSNDGDVIFAHGSFDCWLLKLDSIGNIKRKKPLGGSLLDYARDVLQTNDDKFVVAGVTISNNGNVSGNHGNDDFWIVKLNDGGGIQWQKALGGSKDEMPYSIEKTNDGGYIVVGYTKSNDGDVSGNHGGWDGWLVKLAPESVGTMETLANPEGHLEVFPNPASHTVSLKIASEETILTVNISDMSGRTTRQYRIQNGGDMDISDLPNGTYLVIASTPSGKVYSGKVDIKK